jgi:hypothetical protein
MSKIKIPLKFSLQNFNPQTLKRWGNYLGPMENFYNVKTVNLINLRIIYDNKIFKYKTVNNHTKEYNYKVHEYIRGVLRSYADGILTSVI